MQVYDKKTSWKKKKKRFMTLKFEWIWKYMVRTFV